MAFRRDSGLNRWKPDFRIKVADTYISHIENTENPKSNIQGEKKYSSSHERQVETNKPPHIRVRDNKKRGRRMSEVSEEVIQEQQVRADGYYGGDGGRNQDPNKLKEDKDIVKVSKSELGKATRQTEINISESGAGHFQGGEDRQKAKSNKFVVDNKKETETKMEKRADMVNEEGKYAIKLVKKK